MKKKKDSKGIVKGAPSGLVISLAVHAAAFFLAGLFVVFTVVQKEEKKFVPPKPVDRPKMKLKKPKVKVKKSAKPKSTQRIVTKVQKASMPDIQLPEMSGVGDGLAGDVGGFDIAPNLEEMTLIGGEQSIGNDLEATFYDMKRSRGGRPIPTGKEGFTDVLKKFVDSKFKPSVLSRYYQSPKKLYPTCVMIPSVPSYIGPSAFNEDTEGYYWAVHYKGQLVYPEDITFRFWGQGDDVLVVGVDGEVVLNGSWRGTTWDSYYIAGHWSSMAGGDDSFYFGNNYARGGDWIELKAGVPRDLDIIIGEVPGGSFCAMLAVEVQGVDYPTRGQGAPMFPMFKTAEPTHDLLDVIYRDLVQNEVSLTNGPVFKDYFSKPREPESVEPDTELAVAVEEEVEEMLRMWTTVSGKQFEGEFITTMGNDYVFKSARGKQIKVKQDEIVADDREWIELANPPDFKIDFVKRSEVVLNRYRLSPQELDWNSAPPRVNDYTFGAKVKQTTASSYNHELTIEYFAIAKEHLGDKYILVDRASSTFIPTRENERSHAFAGERVIEFREYNYEDSRRGMEYAGNLVTITDSRGEIIQYSASNKWLWENLDNLKKMPVGRYMDKTCTRTFPTSPKPFRY